MRRRGWMKFLLQREVCYSPIKIKKKIFIPPGISYSWAFTAMMTQSLKSCKFMEIYSIVRFCYRSYFTSLLPFQAARKDEKWNEKSERENLKKTIRIHHCFHSERNLSIYPLESSFTRSRSRILFDFWSQFNTFPTSWDVFLPSLSMKKSEKEAELQLVARRRGG